MMKTLLWRLKKLSLALLCPVLMVPMAHAQAGYEDVDLVVKNFMADRKVPGFAACVVKNDKITWSNSYGSANIEKGTAMSLDGIMNIGSVSKTFTTAAAMQLWEKGLLDLNADVNKYLDFEVKNPKYPDNPITVFQLMTHTSSIQDGKAYGDSYACGDPVVSLHDWVHESLTEKGKFFNGGDNFGDRAPGSPERKYSNVAFGLLGLVVEKVSGQPFNEYCRKFIFQPLGMKNTGWMLSEINTRNHITPYTYVTEGNRQDLMESKLYPGVSEFKAGTFAPACLYSFPNYTDGLLRTSVRELSYYLIAMMNGGEYKGKRILKKETIDKMLTVQAAGNNFQGLTWHTETLADSTKLWGHSGGDPGITTFLFFNPVNKTGVITFQNAATGGTFSTVVTKIYTTAVASSSVQTAPASRQGYFYADELSWSEHTKEIVLKGKINVRFTDNNFKGDGSFSGLGRVNLLVVNGKKVKPDMSVNISGKNCLIKTLSKEEALEKYGPEGESGAIEISIP